MKKIFLLLLSSICLVTCTNDPVFESKEAQAVLTKYLIEETPISADVFCQVESNLTTWKIKLQYSTNAHMEQCKMADFSPTSDYPLGFSKKAKVFRCQLSDLENNTTYYGKLLVISPLETILATENIVFSTKDFSNEGIYLYNIKDVTLTAATAIGWAPLKNEYSYTKIGFYYSSNADLSDANRVSGTWISYNNLNQYSGQISGLLPNTTYYCAAVVSIEGSEYVSKAMSFKTLTGVTTGDAYNITTKTATCSYYVDDLGDSSMSGEFETGILYGTSRNLNFQNGISLKGANFVYTGGTYEVNLSNLVSGTTYYYCAYAKPSTYYHAFETGSMLGEIKSFTTE